MEILNKPEEVNEESTAFLTLNFKDKDGQPEQPAEIKYWIHDLFSGEEVRGETTVQPANSVEITLSVSDNTLINDTNKREGRLVTIEATYGANEKQTGQFHYNIKPLAHIETETP